jgi:hypothetical protein
MLYLGSVEHSGSAIEQFDERLSFRTDLRRVTTMWRYRCGRATVAGVGIDQLFGI